MSRIHHFIHDQSCSTKKGNFGNGPALMKLRKNETKQSNQPQLRHFQLACLIIGKATAGELIKRQPQINEIQCL